MVPHHFSAGKPARTEDQQRTQRDDTGGLAGQHPAR